MQHTKLLCAWVVVSSIFLGGAADAAILHQELLTPGSTIVAGQGVSTGGAVDLSLTNTSHRETNSCTTLQCPQVSRVLGYFALFEPALGTLTHVSLSGQFTADGVLVSSADRLPDTSDNAGLTNESTGRTDVTIRLGLPGGPLAIEQFQSNAAVISNLSFNAFYGTNSGQFGKDQNTSTVSRVVDLSSVDLSGFSQAFVRSPNGVAVGTLDAILAPFVTQTWQCDTNLSIGLTSIRCDARTSWSLNFNSVEQLALEYEYVPASAIPEPGSAVFLGFGLGLAGLALFAGRRRRRAHEDRTARAGRGSTRGREAERGR
jgi:MYXO-CTERM domain-containing protein